MIGEGKYDAVCTQARLAAKAKGALLVIFDGEYGHGFSAQLPPDMTARIPAALREAASQIEADLAHQSLVAATNPSHQAKQ